ncbi:MAG: J domain-containing protein [Terrimesophilobacter sp.]
MPVPVPRDPYSVLGVPRGASQAEVRSAFRALVRSYHPDTRDPSHASGAEPQADAQLRALLAAYRILRDPTSRTAYDRDHPPVGFRAAAPKQAPPQQTTPSAADHEAHRPVWIPRRATPRASDLFLADPFYASSYFADPHFGDPYFIRIIR